MTNSRLLTAAVLAGVLAAAPVLAYTVVLKDGTSIIALQPYSIEGDTAIVTLPSGTQTTFPAAEIDVEETDEVNRLGLRRGYFLDRPELKVVTEPVQRPERVDAFKEFVRQNPSMEPLARRKPVGREMQETPAGNPNYFTLSRIDPAPEVGSFVEDRLSEQGQRYFRVLAGSLPEHILVDVTTANEAEVFAGMRAAATALIETRRQHTGIEAIELILSTSNGSRAGQFLLTPSLARALLDERTDIGAFFLQNVQF